MSDRVVGYKIGGGTVEGVVVRMEAREQGGPGIPVVRDDSGCDWRCIHYNYTPSIVTPVTPITESPFINLVTDHTPSLNTPVTTRLLPTDSAARKRYPMASGLLDYFPDALAEVSNVSWVGNEKHNPGEPLHHARGKSMDHADCCMRHLQERGGFDTIVIDGVEHRVRHSAALAWRALALCQEEIEKEKGLPLPRGARA